MEKAKAQNKKLVYMVVGLSFALVAVLGALIGVFAATNQTFGSSFSVNYKLGDNLAARVRTEKYVPFLDADGDGLEDGAVNIIVDSKGNEIERDANDYVVFNAADATSEKDVYIGEVNLNPYASKAYFYFTIESLMDSGYIRVLCNPTYGENTSNMKTDIAYCNIDEPTGFDPTKSASTLSEERWTKAHYNNIPAGGYKMIRITLAVHNINHTANCSGTFDIQLDYSSVTGLEALDDDTKSTIQSNTTAEQIIFAYAEEQPEGAAQTSAAKPMADTGKKIWTVLDGTTLYVYSNYTIDLPADCSAFFANRSTLKTLELTNFNTSNVTNMYRMFYNCTALQSLNLTSFDTSSATSFEDMFYKCGNLTSLDLTNFNTLNVTTMLGMFSDCTSLTNLNLSSFDTRNVMTMEYMFYKCSALKNFDVSKFDTKKVTSMKGMFSNCESVTSLELSNFNTSAVTTMRTMFQSCKALTRLDISHFDTQNVTDMLNMFRGCILLQSIDVDNFNTGKVADFSGMFEQCEKVIKLEVSKWDTSAAVKMSFMFNKCYMLEELNVSNFDTALVNDMKGMFQCCEKLTNIDVSNFDTSLVTDMSYMFGDCYGLTELDVSSFSTSDVINMQQMFGYCSSLVTVYASETFVVGTSTTTTNMFTNCTKLVGAISYSSSKIDGTYANCESGYFTYKEKEA
ncbi:MAG: BspA family leucine-rich repeat surface protein [Clostridia bacterium]|nr:BspA family leucine-rich repeat surface protein [Clostridia bacterium]